MAILLSDELRLLYAAALLLVPWLCAYRLARCCLADMIESASAAFVILYAIQYVSACIPGLVHLLNPISIAATAIALITLLELLKWRTLHPAVAPPSAAASPGPIFIACLVFLVAYLAALIHHQSLAPVTSNDALTYHLPAAVQWLQTHQLGFYEAWFYNPANSYSPLAGSTFIAYLLAPIGNDVLARFVEAPALLFLFFAMVALLRRLNASIHVAALIALAAVLSRPFMSQTILAKDDLFLVAFAIAALVGMSARVTKENRFAPIVAGIALGLFFATKYTALFSIPIVLIAIDLPRRNGWHARDYTIASLIALILAGPWYARNWILTANPLYPADVRLFGITIFPGMFHAARSHFLATPDGIWNVFTVGYYGLPPLLAIPVLIAWLVGLVLNLRELRRNALLRAVLLGSALSILLFVFTSPYGEMRFAYPAIALLFACIPLILARFPLIVQLIIAAAVAIASALTAFRFEMALNFTIIAIIVAATYTTIWYLLNRPRSPRLLKSVAIVIVLLATVFEVYVEWHAYIGRYRDEGTPAVWSDPTLYDGQAQLWQFIRQKTDSSATIAYTDTYLVYPLMGFDFDHRLVYIPTRKNLKTFHDLPRIVKPITGEEIPAHILSILDTDADRNQWMTGISQSNADYLYISTINPAKPTERLLPPEYYFAASAPLIFQPVFPPVPNPEIPGIIYKIHRQP